MTTEPQKDIKNLPERASMAGTYNFTRWHQTKQKKTVAINNLNPTTNFKTLTHFFGAKQFSAKFIPNLSEKTDNMRQLLKKGTK